MGKTLNVAVALFTATAMLTAPFAEAARLGGARSSGMSRSYSSPSPVYSAPRAAPQPMPAPAPVPQRSGPGWGGVAAGAAAGAAAGYMLGQSGNHGNGMAMAPGQNPAGAGDYGYGGQNSGGISWGLILLLLGLTVAGFIWFKRRAMPATPADGNLRTQGQAGQELPGSSGRVFHVGGAGPLPVAAVGERLPDGTETPNFLRQAKASFMHLQTMNSPDNIDDLRKYLTPQLFESIKADIMSNTETAEFPQLEAEVVEATTQGNQYLASVRFFGRVSESLNEPEQPFQELWHFIKPLDAGSKWLVAGIQQI